MAKKQKIATKRNAAPEIAKREVDPEELIGTKRFSGLLQKQLNGVITVPDGTSADEAGAFLADAAALYFDLKAEDGVERLIACQMVTTHNVAMNCLSRGLQNGTVEGKDVYWKYADRFLTQFAQMVEALNRHRGKGQQKITVERIQVASGGRAVVGNVGASSQASNSEPQALAYAPGKTLDLNVQERDRVKRK